MSDKSVKDKITQVSFHGSARLDPRLKLIMLITLGCTSFFINGDVPELLLMLGVTVFICAGSAPGWGIRMLVIYIVISYLNTCLKYIPIPVVSLLMGIFGVTIIKAIPVISFGRWVMKSTYMDELAVALERAGLPRSVIIPFVVMFRYIPTLGIEYRMIRNTMKIRGVCDSFIKIFFHPFSTIEYILIPLLMRCLKVSDELAASGTTRGMERSNRRYSILEVGFGVGEYLAIVIMVLFVVTLFVLERTSIGQYVLWRQI
ncbi:MAG: energy-coupling factor transporter transmembrane protein EcfT [Lachnospiraceae bacterium]|nr:energy-coupling factor transporter transmembrane protein EcfT [Lachnospiraceae bacterium]